MSMFAHYPFFRHTKTFHVSMNGTEIMTMNLVLYQ